MLNLFKTVIESRDGSNLTEGEKTSVYYHSLFDFPINTFELIKWRASDSIGLDYPKQIIKKNDHYFVEGEEELIYKKLLRKKISAKKLAIARRASHLISFIPTIKMVAVTGSLAMENAADDSDIDLMMVTRRGTLWTTRLLTYCLLHATGYLLRKPRIKNERDALCLNMWLDESDLKWKNKNIYSAHEIAQIKPLVNKNNTYEKFLSANRWILKYWPNSVRTSSKQQVASSMQKEKTLLHATFYMLLSIVEKFAYKFQYKHMRSKITREVITPTRALFHPQDWGKVVLKRLNS